MALQTLDAVHVVLSISLLFSVLDFSNFDEMVQRCQAREVDRIGNDRADKAAHFGRGRVDPSVIDARRDVSGVRRLWYPIMLEVHRFFSAFSRTCVTRDGSTGTATDPLVWSAVSLP